MSKPDHRPARSRQRWPDTAALQARAGLEPGPHFALGDPDGPRGPHFMLGDPEAPWWRPSLALLYLPLILFLMGTEWFLGATPIFMFLSFVGFTIAYVAFELIAIWKFPSRRGW